MAAWAIRHGNEEIDLEKSYAANPRMFSIKLFHGGEFTRFPGRKYVKGKVNFVDLLDIDTFSVHEIHDMMESLGYVQDGNILYYHFRRPNSDLDFGLFALGNDQDVLHLSTYVGLHKLIEVYTEHNTTTLHTYRMSPNPSRVRIQEIPGQPSCSRPLFLKWTDKQAGECSGSGKDVQGDPPNEIPSTENPGLETHQSQLGCNIPEGVDNLEDHFKTPPHPTSNHENEPFHTPKSTDGPLNNDSVNLDADPFDFSPTNNYHDIESEAPNHTNTNSEHASIDNEDFEDTDGIGSEESDSGDNDFFIDEENLVDDVVVDMKDFFLHVDKNVEWVGDFGGSSGHVEEGKSNESDEEVEVINTEMMQFDSSSDEDNGNTRTKSIKAYRRAQENNEARVSDPFYVFQRFSSADELKEKIRLHAIETRREIELIKNDKNRVRAVFMGGIPDLGQLNSTGPTIELGKSVDVEKNSKCPWVLYASKWSQDIDWEVKTYQKEHRCLQTREVKGCTYKFLAKNIVQQIESNPEIPTRALQDQLQRQYELDIHKMKVFRAKAEAMKHIRGDYGGQYTMLRDYILELQTRNPQTTVKLEVEPEPNPRSETRIFKRIYICLGSLKKGFRAGKRDYLGLDGAFMKGPYPGFILTAVGLDGNNHTYPLAYAVIESENINSWKWFLGCLGDDLDLGTNSNFTFVTDRQKGVLQAIASFFPCVENRYCLRHIHENMKAQWKGLEFKKMLWKCASTTTIQQFNHAMEEMKKLNSACYDWLKAIPPQHWARSHFTGRAHCDGLLNNLCETLNNQLRDARDQPIIFCLEFIREYLMKRIVTVQKDIDKAVGPLTPTATNILQKTKEDAAQYKGVFCGNGKYQVTGPWMDQCVVDMVYNTCTCRKWELTGLPCKHAIVAIWDMRKNNHNVGVPETWVNETYWLNTWREMNSYKIEPINGRRMWDKSPCPTTLLPPKHHIPIGRPKKKRRKAAVELEDLIKGNTASRKNKTVRCSKCKNLGHNARSCKGQVEGEIAARKKGKTVESGKKGQTSNSVGSGKTDKKGQTGKSVGSGKTKKKGADK